MKAQFIRDFNSESTFYADQIIKRRLEGYLIAAPFGPIAWAIAAGILEGQLIPKINAKIKDVENNFGDIDKIVAAASVEFEQIKEDLNNELHKFGELKVTAEASSALIPLSSFAKLRDKIDLSTSKLYAKVLTYIMQIQTNYSLTSLCAKVNV